MKLKKLLGLAIVACLLFAAAACAPVAEAPAAVESSQTPAAVESSQAPAAQEAVAEEVKGVTIPKFSVEVNGVPVTNETMAEYPVYSAAATSTNSAGTTSTKTYVGFAVADVLKAAGIADGYKQVEAVADDGYAIKVDAALASQKTTLLAISENGNPFKSSPWFAPCSSETTGDFLKGMVSIVVDGGAAVPAAPSGSPDEKADEAGVPSIKDVTEKVEFADFSFKVNGKEVTNSTLEGLSIYKINSFTEKDGKVTESTYGGYKLADVLAACGVTGYKTVKAVANDGYESKMELEAANSDYTLVAIEKDKEVGEDGTVWVAPCESKTGKDYAKLVVEIIAE